MVDFATLGVGMDTSALLRGKTALTDVSTAAVGAERSADRAGRAFGGMGRGLGVMAAAALSAASAMALMGSSIRAARAFSGALAETGTLINGNAQEMAAIEVAASRMARTFGTTATAQVEAFYQAISAGSTSAAQATELLEAANRLAIGGVTTTTVAVGALSTAINSYGAANLSAAEASDILFTGVRLGVTTIDELAGAVGNVLPIANALGIGFEEVVAATAALTTQGLTTAQSVTGLRAALVAVTGPTSEARDLAASLGLEFNSTSLTAQGFAGFMQSVIDATGGSTDSMRTLFGSVEATTAVMALAGGGAAALATGLDAMTDSAGATQAAFDIVADSLNQRMTVALATLADIARDFGGVLLAVAVPALETFASVAELAADNADKLLYVLPFLIAPLASIAFSAAASAVSLGAAGVAAFTLTGIMTAATTAATFMWVALGGPVGVAVALAAGLMLIVNANREVRDTAVLATQAHEQYEVAIRGVVEASGLSAAGDYVRDLEAQMEASLAAAVADRDLMEARMLLASMTDPDAYLMFGAQMDEMVRTIARIRAEMEGLGSAADVVVPALAPIVPILDDAAVEAGNAATAAGMLARTIETLGQSEMGGLVGQIMNVAGALGIAADEAARAVGGIRALAIFQAEGGGGRGGDPRSFIPGNSAADMDLTAADAFLANLNRPSLGGGGGGGGGGADREAPLTALQAMLGPDDPTDAIEAWYETANTALADAQLLERGMLEEHASYRLQIEQSYSDQLMALRRSQQDEDLGHYQSFFGTMAGVFQSGGERMLGISKAFGLAEAAVSMWRGAAKALELPFPASLAAWGQVIATGAKALQGISSAKPGNPGISSGGQAASAAAPPPQSQNVIIDLVGATGRQIDQFQAFADTFNEASRQGLMTNVTVRGA